MGQIFTGDEGYREMLFGNAAHTLDSAWSKYEEAFSREYQLEKAGYSVRRTELLDSEGKITGRGVPTMIYMLWIRRGRVEKTRGRKPKSKGKYGAKKKDPRFAEDQRTTGSDLRTTAKRPTGRSDPRSSYAERGKYGVKKPRIGHKIVSGAKNPKYNARRNVRANAIEKGRKLR